jgi:hypothetical protein
MKQTPQLGCYNVDGDIAAVLIKGRYHEFDIQVMFANSIFSYIVGLKL